MGAKSDEQRSVAKKAPNKSPKKYSLKWYVILIYIVFLSAWIIASMFFSQIVVGNIAVIVFRESVSEPLPTLIYSTMSYLLMLFLIIFVPYKVVRKKKLYGGKISLRETLGIHGLPTWTDIGLSIVGLIVSVILATFFATLFSLFPWFDASAAQDVGYNTYMFGVDRLIAFSSLVIIAPIAEELIFRGWFYGRMRDMTSKAMGYVVSMLLSSFIVSLIFGIMHLQWNVGVNVFAMSLVLCGLREITGTVYAGILMHMLKNGVAFYFLYVVGI